MSEPSWALGGGVELRLLGAGRGCSDRVGERPLRRKGPWVPYSVRAVSCGRSHGALGSADPSVGSRRGPRGFLDA